MSINISRHFLLRKLHQLTGVLPLGVFLLEHFYTNSKALGGGVDAAGKPISGAQLFNEAVADLQSIPYIIFVEVLGIFIPLIYHAVYGLIITYEGRPNVGKYDYGRNWLYFFQRVTGVILFFFITFHVLNFRFGVIAGSQPDIGRRAPRYGIQDRERRVQNLVGNVHLHHRHRLDDFPFRQRAVALFS